MRPPRQIRPNPKCVMYRNIDKTNRCCWSVDTVYSSTPPLHYSLSFVLRWAVLISPTRYGCCIRSNSSGSLCQEHSCIVSQWYEMESCLALVFWWQRNIVATVFRPFAMQRRAWTNSAFNLMRHLIICCAVLKNYKEGSRVDEAWNQLWAQRRRNICTIVLS